MDRPTFYLLSVRRDNRTNQVHIRSCPGHGWSKTPASNYGRLGGRPTLVSRGSTEADGCSEACTFFRITVRFGNGCDMISERGQFINGGGPPMSAGELRMC